MRIAVVEDNDSEAAVLDKYLKKFAEENDLQIDCSRFSDGNEVVREYQCTWDLILLDIEMPLMNGMEAARKIREKDSEVIIIFITQMAQYAIEGYSVRALDYILKPIHYYSFSSKLDQVREILAARQKRKILINTRSGQIRLSPEHLLYVEVQDHTLCYHTQQEPLYATGNQSLSRLAEELSDCGFARCHQAFLVNLQYVIRYDKKTVCLSSDTLPMSRTYYKTFTQALLTSCSMEGNL